VSALDAPGAPWPLAEPPDVVLIVKIGHRREVYDE